MGRLEGLQAERLGFFMLAGGPGGLGAIMEAAGLVDNSSKNLHAP
jgi:hypothetical protein